MTANGAPRKIRRLRPPPGMCNALATGLLGCILASPASADGTARAALLEVNAVARKWQADAAVTHVSTLHGKSDGTAREWLYTVYSRKAAKSAIVTARDARIELDEVGRNTSKSPIGEFMDSDQAMNAARKAGLVLAKQNGMGLTTMGQATGRPRVLWTVTVMTDTGFSAVTLDAKDGSLIKRDDVKLK